MSYTVKFLDNEAFDKLPYNRVGTSVGVADRNSGVAYVRDTGDPMDVFTAYHELEHLKGDDLHEFESPGEDGIYYKGFGQMLQSIAPILPFVPYAGVGGSMIASGVGAKMSKNSAKQQQPQQASMDQFNPMGSVASPMGQATPAVSQVGGAGGVSMGGGGDAEKIRQLLRQNQAGFHSGRDAGGF